MDEAERCHALAILDHGTLVAEGSPAELEDRIDASIVIVESEQPRRVGKLLEQEDFIHSSAQIGNELRVMVAIDQPSPDKAVSAVIQRAGLHLAGCKITRPGLEDVFVAATRSRKSAA
jgi:ABC-2 type transport system ATP-binding protein